MKRTYLKIFVASLLLIGSLPFVACSNDDEGVENVITYDELPSAAKNFLSTYFSGVDVSKIEKETTGGVVIYEVELKNNYEIVFNMDGNWIEVDAPSGMTIPSGIAPEVIENYVNTNYPGYGINEINKTGMGYNVELTNGQGGSGLTLSFNEAGEVVNTDYN